MQLNEIWNPAVGALTARNIVERSSERQPICILRVNSVVISMVDMFYWVSLQRSIFALALLVCGSHFGLASPLVLLWLGVCMSSLSDS